MKKRVLATFSVLAVIFTITWNIAADHFKADTEHFLSMLNKSNDISMTYNKISVTGFPFKIGSSIEGVKIRFATGKFLKSIPETYFSQAFPALSSKDKEILFSLEHHSTFTGNVEVTTNVLANTLKIKFGTGKIISKDARGEKAINSIGETVYTIKLNHTHLETLFNKNFYVFNLDQMSINDIKSVSAESKNVVITDEKNNILLSSKEMVFSLCEIPMTHQKAIFSLTAKEQETQIYDDYAQWFTGLESYKILYQMMGQLRVIDSSSVQGKNSHVVRLPSLFPGNQLTQGQIQALLPHLHILGMRVLQQIVSGSV